MKDYERLYKLYDECTAELNSIGIVSNPIQSITVNRRAKNRFGLAVREHGVYRIEISEIVLRNDVSDDKAKEVIIHEILHCCDNCMTHKGKWKAYANKVNARLGYNITRCNSFDNIGVKREEVVNFKYKITCTNCGKIVYRLRASRVICHPNRYRCGTCGGELKVEKINTEV